MKVKIDNTVKDGRYEWKWHVRGKTGRKSGHDLDMKLWSLRSDPGSIWVPGVTIFMNIDTFNKHKEELEKCTREQVELLE